MREFSYPFTLPKIRSLGIGDMVSVSGRVFTGRDRLHRYLAEGGKSPVDLCNGAIFHCGPVAIRQGGGWKIRSAGPTTSSRQDAYMADIIEKHQVRLIIGKGGMDKETCRACLKHGCAYLQAVGGAAVVMAESIQKVEGVYLFREFGEAEAMWSFIVRDLRGIVAIDSRGHSLHEDVRVESGRILAKLMRV